MSDTTVAVSQRIVSFTSEVEGSFHSIQKCVAKVTEDLAIYLAESKSRGDSPVVVSISQSTGHFGHVGFYASLTAVITD